MHKKLNGWFPKFNNAFELYAKNGSDWEKVEASEICSTPQNDNQPYEAWKDMPQEAIDFVASLPEFDAEMFKTITGIEASGNSKKQELLNKANELLQKAEELRSKAEEL